MNAAPLGTLNCFPFSVRARRRYASKFFSLAVATFVAVSGCRASADPWADACSKIHELTGRSAPPKALAPRIAPLADHLSRAEALGFSGAAALRTSDHDLLDQAYGFANWRTGERMTRNTLFDIGSVSKQFTAAAILSLEEQRRLRVEDAISDYLPEVPADKRAITIHQLLTHTAGFEHSVGEANDAVTRADSVRAVLTSPLQSKPGEKYSYSNAGYSLLAAIVEIASGQSYEAFLRQQLWLPAGLKHTGWVLFDRSRDKVALGYSASGEFPTPFPPWIADGPTWGRRGPGAILSTLDDLGRWARALRHGNILSDASLTKMLTPQVAEGPKRTSFYGYGWAISTRDGWCVIDHNGSNNLHYNELAFLPERDLIVQGVILDSFSPLRPRVVDRVLPIAGGWETSKLPNVVLPGRSTANRLEGGWRAPDGTTIFLHAAGDHLLAAANDPGVARLFTPFPAVPPEIQTRIAGVQARLPAIIDALAAGNLGPLDAVLSSRSTSAEEAKYWSKQWPRFVRDNGSYRGAEIIGTSQRDSTWVTWMLVRFAQRNIILGANWDELGRLYLGNDIFLGAETELIPATYSIVRGSNGRLFVYNMSMPGVVELIPDRPGLTMRVFGPVNDLLLVRSGSKRLVQCCN